MKHVRKPGFLPGLVLLFCLQCTAQQPHPNILTLHNPGDTCSTLTGNTIIAEQEDQIQELLQLADEQSIAKDYQAQEQTLTTLLSLGYDEYWIYNDLGYSQLCLQKYTEGIKNIAAGLDENPSNLYLLGNLANYYLLTNQYDRAIIIYKKYKREKIDGKRRFKYFVEDDLKEFERLGIKHPDFKRVRMELRI